MTLENLITTTSSEASKNDADEDCAGRIRSKGWVQGSVIPADRLDVAVGVKSPGIATHWILASQTCNLYSKNFDTIRDVEWVGAVLIDESRFDAVISSGARPRQLHCRATSESGDSALYLDGYIQLRRWTDRRLLADVLQLSERLRDEGLSVEGRQKDRFIGWLARSYTRLELSDELGIAIAASTLEKLIKNVIKKWEKDLFGIFLDIGCEPGADPTTSKPSTDQRCTVETHFVVRNEAVLADIADYLIAQIDEKVGNPNKGPGIPREISRRDRAAIEGLDISLLAQSWTEFSAEDISRMLRYSFSDHLSDSESSS